MGPEPTIATVRARRHLAVQNSAFEAGGQDVAQHHKRLLVGALRDRIETRIGVGDADILGLCPIDLVAENPAAGGAMRVHAAPAILAFAARRDARNQHVVARMEGGHAGACLVDHANAFMAQDAAGAQLGTSPLRICRSVPQMVVLRILRSRRRRPATRAWAGPRPVCGRGQDRQGLSWDLHPGRGGTWRFDKYLFVGEPVRIIGPSRPARLRGSLSRAGVQQLVLHRFVRPRIDVDIVVELGSSWPWAGSIAVVDDRGSDGQKQSEVHAQKSNYEDENGDSFQCLPQN